MNIEPYAKSSATFKYKALHAAQAHHFQRVNAKLVLISTELDRGSRKMLRPIVRFGAEECVLSNGRGMAGDARYQPAGNPFRDGGGNRKS
jgi:hypothetical protein